MKRQLTMAVAALVAVVFLFIPSVVLAARYDLLDTEILLVYDVAKINSLVLGGDPEFNTAGDVTIDDGISVGDGTPSVARGADDAYVEGTFEVDGAARFDSTVAANGAISAASTYTGLDDITLSVPTNGGTGNAANQFIGVPKIAPWSTGAGVAGNASSHTVGGYIDETPAGEWTGTTNVTDSTEATIFRKGTGSLKLAFTAAAVAGNGADNTLAGGNEDWTDDESVGLWLYSDTALTAGHLVLEITDSGAGATTVNVPAVAATTWTWLEIDISGVANASKDVITDIALDLSSAGATALGAFNVYADYMWKWDGGDEEALGLDVYQDGVFAAFANVTAEDQVNTVTVLAEGTDYIIHYETGNDFLVAVADNSTKSLFGLAALE